MGKLLSSVTAHPSTAKQNLGGASLASFATHVFVNVCVKVSPDNPEKNGRKKTDWPHSVTDLVRVLAGFYLWEGALFSSDPAKFRRIHSSDICMFLYVNINSNNLDAC